MDVKLRVTLFKMEKKKKRRVGVGGSSPEPCSRLGKVGSRLDFTPHFLFCPAPLCSAQPEQLHMASLQVKAWDRE